MINLILEISLFLIIALFVGYIFGWFSSKSVLQEKHEEQIHEFKTFYEEDLGKIKQIKEELERYKESNKELSANSGKRTQKIEELEHLVETKDDMIAKLTTQLSHEEDKSIALAKNHEEEMNAFLYERVEITQKYQKLLARLKEKEVIPDKDTDDKSWFGKLFKEPSKS